MCYYSDYKKRKRQHLKESLIIGFALLLMMSALAAVVFFTNKRDTTLLGMNYCFEKQVDGNYFHYACDK